MVAQLATVPQFDAIIAQFLARHGFPVATSVSGGIVGTPQELAHGGGMALPGRIDYGRNAMPAVQAAAARVGRRGGVNQRQIKGVYTALHEGGHQMRYGRTPDVANANIDWEEGATDAVARDLLPIAVRRLFGHRMMPTRRREANTLPGAYDTQVRNIRQLSVFGSGAKRWEDRAARVWRRQFQHADQAGRQQMYDAAMARRTR